MIGLAAGSARASVEPQMGGGLAGLWVGDLPVLRPWSGRLADGPFALACNLLVPFSNRISQGGFFYEGQYHAVAPNFPGEPFPIHGDAFQRSWLPDTIAQDSACLALGNGQIGPYRYAAVVTYQLSPHALDVRLAVTNRADEALPFGLGIHPWFPRHAETRLQFSAIGYWPETAAHLPSTDEPVSLDAGGAWQNSAPLPDGWINTAFAGWDGRARIILGAERLPVDIMATGFGTVQIYSPSTTADFFCLEPVSHPVDAHNLPGQPGLVRLMPGETLGASMTLSWGHAA